MEIFYAEHVFIILKNNNKSAKTTQKYNILKATSLKKLCFKFEADLTKNEAPASFFL